MFLFLLTIHVILAVLLVTCILLQQGRGASTGAAFGSGASTTIFGSQGSGSFLSRITWTIVGLFFAVNLTLAYMTNRTQKTVVIDVPAPASEPANQAPSNQGSDIPTD